MCIYANAYLYIREAYFIKTFPSSQTTENKLPVVNLYKENPGSFLATVDFLIVIVHYNGHMFSFR